MGRKTCPSYETSQKLRFCETGYPRRYERQGMLNLYRADKRDFEVGSVVKTAQKFVSLNPNGSQKIEEVFEIMRPQEKPKRDTCLYLFEDLNDAKKHWSKMSDGKLYEVSLLENDILHRGDMELFDKAFMSRDNMETVKTCAKDYWDGKKTTHPIIEILVRQATISRIISKDQNERINYLRSWALT